MAAGKKRLETFQTERGKAGQEKRIGGHSYLPNGGLLSFFWGLCFFAVASWSLTEFEVGGKPVSHFPCEPGNLGSLGNQKANPQPPPPTPARGLLIGGAVQHVPKRNVRARGLGPAEARAFVGVRPFRATLYLHLTPSNLWFAK